MDSDTILDSSESLEGKGIKIYSQRAIMFFSVFFTTVFGGVLLYQNLKDFGKPKEANQALIFSIGCTGLLLGLVFIIGNIPSGVSIGLNIGGAVAMNTLFLDKHIPNHRQMESKKIWKPLVISLFILLPFVAALYFTVRS